MTSRRLRPRARRLAVPLVAPLVGGLTVLALVSGCSADTGEPGAAAPEGQEPGETVEPPAVSPLTGLPLAGGTAPRHPVVVVKVDNSASSAPQVGLSQADLVVEELVEGGITRLATFFYTQVPETVGPVRSMRATDIGIVQPLGASLVASGGAPQTVERVADAGISTYTEGSPGFFRDGSRSAPYNLFAHLDELVGTLKAGDPPEPYLPFGKGLPRGKPARALTATFASGSSSSFELREGRYVNTDTNAAAGDTFDADTVLVLRVRVGDAGYLDPAGYPVPETTFSGRGEAAIFHGGRVVRGSWVKEGLGAPVQLVDKAGEPVALPPGRVWIELLPADRGSLTVR